MDNVKHYILTSITLGLIAAGSALLIGGSNALTKKQIENNEIAKVNSGIASIFGDSAKINSEQDLSYKYANHVYEIVKEDNVNIGFAFRSSGSNMYGKISLLIGYNMSKDFIAVSIITNEQTYAQTLVDEYIVPLNNASRDIDDVSCGATYGAKLVSEMINEASEVVNLEGWK